MRWFQPVNRTGHGRRVVIPVLYDGADLHVVAARLELSTDEVVNLHSSIEYDVFAIGFLPGFPTRVICPRSGGLAAARFTPAPRAGGFGGHRRPADGDLSRRIARRLASAGNNAPLHRRSRRRLLPDPGRRSNPVRADLRLRIRGPTP